MSVMAFIGDEVSAAGYRLAGAQVFTPEPRDTAAAFEDARASADVVLITADAARHLGPAKLETAQTAAKPLVLVVRDIRGRAAPPDMEEYVRTTLGLEL